MEWLASYAQNNGNKNKQNNNQQNTNKRNTVEFFILPPCFCTNSRSKKNPTEPNSRNCVVFEFYQIFKLSYSSFRSKFKGFISRRGLVGMNTLHREPWYELYVLMFEFAWFFELYRFRSRRRLVGMKTNERIGSRSFHRKKSSLTDRVDLRNK